MTKLNHQWEKNPNFKREGGFYAEATCKRCGLVKTSHKSSGWPPFYSTHWSRSGQDYGFRSRGPECVDWNDNSLD